MLILTCLFTSHKNQDGMHTCNYDFILTQDYRYQGRTESIRNSRLQDRAVYLETFQSYFHTE